MFTVPALSMTSTICALGTPESVLVVVGVTPVPTTTSVTMAPAPIETGSETEESIADPEDRKLFTYGETGLHEVKELGLPEYDIMLTYADIFRVA